MFISFLWGLQPIIHKYILKSIDPKTIMVIGGVFYMMCMLGFAASFWKTVKKDWAKLDAKTIMLIGAVSVLTGFVANMLYFFVLKKRNVESGQKSVIQMSAHVAAPSNV